MPNRGILKDVTPFLVLALIQSLAVAPVWTGCGPATHKGVNDQDSGTEPSDGGQADAFWTDPFVDDDGDGYSENQGDCDDLDPTVTPFADEICDDGKDNDCDGYVDTAQPDVDQDGWGPCRGDCDDANPDVNPGMEEIPANGLDDNCDGIVDGDFDGDGYTEADGDCRDFDPKIHPGAEEHCFDGEDNNCNGFADANEPDADGDGYGPCQGDCDDTNPQIHPGRPEIAGDGIDNNCDYLVDEDIDGDGWTEANGDCDDNDAQVHPGASEVCGDGKDNNCNGLIDAAEPDGDGDGLTACDGDCDDTNPAARPGYVEDTTDGIDNDCNGLTDDQPQCDCTAVNEAQAMDLCIPGVTITYGGHAQAHGYRVNNNFGAIAPRHGCGYFTVSSGIAWSTAPQPASGLNVLDANPVSVTGCVACGSAQGCCDNNTDFDVAYVHMEIQVPLNAQGFSFDFIYLSSEYPEWVGSEFNDTFYAVVSSSALPSTQNVSFDSNGDPLTVNNNFFETPPNLTQSIAGTGYDASDPGASPPYVGSASGWLTTSCPATPGETLHIWFWVHDEGDHILDSCVVVDNWQWVLTPLSGPITIK